MATRKGLYLNCLLRKIAYIIIVKVTKFCEDQLNDFSAVEEKPGDGPFRPLTPLSK